MNDKRRAEIRARLEGMLRVLRARAAALVDGLGVHRGAGDLGDAARDTEEGADLAQGVDRASIDIAAIEGALDRLAAGSYGKCICCRKAIHPARLAALPAAARCVVCQSRAGKDGHPPT